MSSQLYHKRNSHLLPVFRNRFRKVVRGIEIQNLPKKFPVFPIFQKGLTTNADYIQYHQDPLTDYSHVL